jgi:protein SCO1/2
VTDDRSPSTTSLRLHAAAIPALLVLIGIAAAAPAAAHDREPGAAANPAVAGRGEGGPFAFLDRQGRQVRLADYRGKPLVVSFIYTGCTSACPPATKLLGEAIRKARRVVGADSFRVATIGFNLPHDSPEAMRDHARRFGIEAHNWEFLTPFEPQLGRLTAEFGFSYARTSWGFDHITQLTVVDQNGRIYRQVYGDDFPIPLLVDPLKELIEGTPVPMRSLADFVERVRILCTVYDPRTNTYRFKTTVIGEIVSFVAVTGALLWFIWSERRRRRRDERPR